MNTEPETLALGTIIADKYRLDRLLGRGGFGAVFAATVVGGGRVAVKVFSRAMLDRTGGEARFQREAELVRRLSHPNTVRVLDAGADVRGLLYIAFELLEGRSVEEALAASGALPPRRAAEIAIDVLDALEEAHRLGVIHRDIKPANLFLVHAGAGPEQVKVLDFGIAKSTNPNTRAGLTREGTTMGTPVYMAPEQMIGREVDARTDLFALGIVLGEMIDGRSPYGDEASGIAIMTDRIAGKPIPFPSSLLSSPIGPILSRATAADPAHRFSSASEMRQALRDLLPSLPVTSTRSAESAGASSTLGGADTAVSTDPSFSGSSSNGQNGWPRGTEPSPRAVSVEMSLPNASAAPQVVAPTLGPSLSASQPPDGSYPAGPAREAHGWPQGGSSPYAPSVMASAQRSSSGAGVGLVIGGIFLLVLIGGGIAGAMLFLRAPVSKHQTTQDEDEETSEPTTKKKPSDPSPGHTASPAPQAPRQPRPSPSSQPLSPQPHVSHVHELPCPRVDALTATSIGPHVRAVGLEIKGVLTMCPGDMVNFVCVGATGNGVTAKGPDGEGSVYLLTSQNHADLDRFLVSERDSREDEETLLVGKSKILVISFGEPYASNIAARICR